VQQRFANLFNGAAIVQRAPHVALEFLRALQGGQRGQGDQAAGFQRQTLTAPDTAPGVLVDEVLQRLGEVRGIAQGTVDEDIAHDLTTQLFTVRFCFAHAICS
jgi:hypothetical protein